MRDLKIYAQSIEPEALNQINTLLDQPAFQDCKVRIMPDVHAGAGCVIGFTANLGDKVIPNIVGVDIGCGMLTVKLAEKDIDLQKLDNVIRTYVPSGRNVHECAKLSTDWLHNLYCEHYLHDEMWLRCSLGTLGGGNHFIEIDKDSLGNLYLIIHTGSRNLGKQVANHYQQAAIDSHYKSAKIVARNELIKQYKEQGRHKEISEMLKKFDYEYKTNSETTPKELCYLEGYPARQYKHDMGLCQQFAVENRWNIMRAILDNMGLHEDGWFQTIHNYIDLKNNIVRKGAISASFGEMVLIPMNMRDGCILGVGRGNADWNYSAPHGAGRVMSRKEARDTLNINEYKKSMEGIFTTSVCTDTIDEAPMAYKPSSEIIDNINDTVAIVDILKPIYNFKASE